MPLKHRKLDYNKNTKTQNITHTFAIFCRSWYKQTIVAIWHENKLGYLSADIICSERRTVFRERSSRKTVSYEEQIMSKDKYPSIFSPQMEAIVFIILQIFSATRAIFKIGEYLTIILRNRAEYRLILSRRGRRPSQLKSDDIPRD